MTIYARWSVLGLVGFVLCSMTACTRWIDVKAPSSSPQEAISHALSSDERVPLVMRDGGQQNPDASFIAMTRDFVTTWSGEYPATADFQRMIEKQIRPAMNATGEGKVDWFFRQWVHGTEVSKLEGDFAVARPGNGYRITGSLTHPGVSSEFRTIVSLYVVLEGKRGAILAQASAILILGALTRQLDLTVNLPSPPKRALINAHRDVLTRR